MEVSQAIRPSLFWGFDGLPPIINGSVLFTLPKERKVGQREKNSKHWPGVFII